MYQECRHIFTSGKKCQSPALKEQPFCYFHSNTRKQPRPANTPYDPYIDPKDTTLDLPSLEEADAIQLALSDVILALAANRIDPRRARILIYGLQVASQNNRHRAAIAAKEEAPAQTVREIHRHEDGTQIGPEQQSPDPEEIEEQRRPPSLGEILLREAEALHAQRLAEEEARKKRQAEKPWEKSQPGIVDLKAATEPSIKLCHPERSAKRAVEGPARTKFVRSLAPARPAFHLTDRVAARVPHISQRCGSQLSVIRIMGWDTPTKRTLTSTERRIYKNMGGWGYSPKRSRNPNRAT